VIRLTSTTDIIIVANLCAIMNADMACFEVWMLSTVTVAAHCVIWTAEPPKNKNVERPVHLSWRSVHLSSSILYQAGVHLLLQTCNVCG